MRLAGVRREELASHPHDAVALSHVNVDAVVRGWVIGAPEEFLDFGDSVIYRVGASLSVVEFGIGQKQFVEPVPLRRIHDMAVQRQQLVDHNDVCRLHMQFPYSVSVYPAFVYRPAERRGRALEPGARRVVADGVASSRPSPSARSSRCGTDAEVAGSKTA